MKKSLGLAGVGCAIALSVASHLTSHARENQPLPATLTLLQHQTLTQSAILEPASMEWEGMPKATPFTLQTDIERTEARGGFGRMGEIHAANVPDLSILSSDNQTLGINKLYAQTFSQDIPQTQDGERFQGVMQYAIAQKFHQRPIGEIVQAIAEKFLGAAYKENLLDQSPEEALVVTLNQFDCVLFVETVLAIARGVALQDYSYSTFLDHLRQHRYWNGQIDGYCSRLHYFSEWIYDNQKRGNVQNIGRTLGGVQLNKKLNFMSTRRHNYPRLVKNDITYECIVQREAQLNKVTINYIPTNQIRRLYSQLQPGDIIAIVTNIPGLDVTHTGLVYRQSSGNIGFIHASPIGKVTIAADLEKYVSRVENAIGILVARPLEPRLTQKS